MSESVLPPVRAIAFWTTILLPMLAFVALATGVASITLPTAIGFLAAYSACAIVGHSHSPH
ncbi:hypothetical protein [Halobiforma nitratireducens]|uniref:hypothetical protein n=1 Tax=Halobiforma nitratireducens TaxID=130048 RepID=UPI001EF9E3A9|nr:hypothetical protein [Halobiforma nitratireducens]